ncbi:phBC6A51 family helix-turn-helix protein [Paenibacillus tengchongensis]|uniref:phBC6A51 family helix-turn-helix protein n=1 Tax=Paenibacillus tengchongensis TaxID=2608684 RepID=UPI00124CE31A|nr:phBC6A51 family helix-turn-helix protein [Paenibacillus tengchongensis]
MALKRLEAHHLIALQWLALPKRGGKTMAEIAEQAQVSRQAVYDWIKDPLFERELKRQIARNTLDRLPEVVDAMAEAAIQDRNAAAAQLLVRMNGMLTEQVEVITADVGAMDRTELDRKLAEFKARRDAVKADE